MRLEGYYWRDKARYHWEDCPVCNGDEWGEGEEIWVDESAVDKNEG